MLCGLVLIYSNTLLKEDRERRLPVHERKPAKSLTSTLTAHAAFALATLYYSLWARIGLAVSMWVSAPLTSVHFRRFGRSIQMTDGSGTDFNVNH